MTHGPALYVTNMHRNFTGVSATAAAVVREQARAMDLRLVGNALPDCPDPVSLFQALGSSRVAPSGKPFSIWHVRRNNEMRAALFARDILRLPIRIVFTSAAQRRHSALPRWLISRMDAVIATTQEAAGFVPHVKAVVAHGVDVDRFCPADNRRAAWAALGHGGDYGIATIGRIRPEKGTDRFVDAMITALPHLPGATALVVGHATPEHQAFLSGLKLKAAQAGLAGRIVFAGEIAAVAMPALVRGLSLLVALPRYEGYGVTPLEAMASAVPFVASDAGYFGGFAGDDAAGLIVRGDDAASAAALAVQQIMADRARFETMAAAARARAVENFSVKTEAAGINGVYEELWAEKET